MMDVRIREERSKSRYMVEAKRENVEGRIYWLPLASFACPRSSSYSEILARGSRRPEMGGAIMIAGD